MILINFSNDTSTPWTPTTIANRLFNNPDSVAAYYAEQSHGKTMLTGTVFGWYTIAASNTTCDYSTWAYQAQLAAGSAIYPYSNVMYVFPFVNACGWAGLGSMPGSQTWISGYPDLRVMGHELGHNFGVHHANSLECTSGGARVALAASGCQSDEYGDPFSIMGDASTRQFPAFHKGELGWLQATSTYTVASSGTYTIAASEARHRRDAAAAHPAHGRRPVRRRAAALRHVLRQLPARIGPGQRRHGAHRAVGATTDAAEPVDTTPGTATYADAALAVGAVADRPRQRRHDHHDGDHRRRRDGDRDRAGRRATRRPRPPTSPRRRWPAASTSRGRPPPTTSASTSYRVFRNGGQIGTTAGLSFHDTVTNGVLDYSVAAVDTQNLVGPVGAAPTISVGDVTPPTAPTGLTAKLAGTTATLTWQAATDNVGVTSYRVYRNGVLLKTATATTAQDTGLKGGQSYSYSVRAADAAANVSAPSAAVPVVVTDGTPPSADHAAQGRRATEAVGRDADLEGRDRQRRGHRLPHLPRRPADQDRARADLHRSRHAAHRHGRLRRSPPSTRAATRGRAAASRR